VWDLTLIANSRYADDREFNDELKERELWNDPAAQFLSVSKLLGIIFFWDKG